MTQKRIRLFLASLVVCLCGIFTHGSASQRQQAAEVPFTVESGILIFRVNINGDGPFYLGLNTGRTQSVFSYQTARDINLTLFSNPGFITNLADPPKLTILSSVDVGKVRFGNIQMYLGENFLPRGSKPLHGILGGDFLKDRIVQIDYPNHIIRFYPDSPFPKDQPSENTQQKAKFAMRYGAKLMLPIIEDAYVNGKKLRVVLDSGFSGTLSLTPAAIEYLDLEAEVAAMGPTASVGNKKLEPRKGEVKTLAIGPLEIASPPTLFYCKGGGLDQKLESFGAIVGNSFLKNFVVTFDYRDKTVMFERK